MIYWALSPNLKKKIGPKRTKQIQNSNSSKTKLLNTTTKNREYDASIQYGTVVLAWR